MVIVRSGASFMWRIIAIKDSGGKAVFRPFRPSFPGTSELGYAFLVPQEMTIFCSLQILCQLLFL